MAEKACHAILITGASSGLGAALARAYAGPGAFLALSGRNRVRLESVAEACRAEGAEVGAEAVDVTDAAAMGAWIRAADDARPLDLVIANAGIGGGTGGDGEDEDQVREIFAVNVGGVLNTILPVLPAMRRRGRGQIAIISSLAGFRGLPGAPAYSASKVAVRAYGEALRPYLAEAGIAVSVVCPGFVETPMTATNRFPMPFLMTADEAARRIQRGLAKEKARIAFPWPLHAAMWLIAALPPALIDPVLRRMPKKA